ncbi:CaiB/BaiF CoA-transferase family protein [soil metagenome]
MGETSPLEGIRVLTLAGNVPGPVAAARFQQLGAAVTKVEPPTGDPFSPLSPAWYRALTRGQEILRLNLKDPAGRERLDSLLEASDLLLTATRPAALERLGLGWEQLHARYPRLTQVAITGYPPPHENRAGHDLTYQAEAGLLAPPALPRTLLADMASGEQAVSAALALLLARERGQGSGYTQLAMTEATEMFAAPLHHGLTAPGGLLGGGLPGYGVYLTRRGWIAVALLEPHFQEAFHRELGVSSTDREALERVFLTRTATEWEEWADGRDLPIAAVQNPGPVAEEAASHLRNARTISQVIG